MKLKINLFFVSVFMLLSCSSEELKKEFLPEEMYVVKFYLALNPEIDDFFDETKSIPQKFPPEPVASKGGEGGDGSDNISFSYIEYAVYDEVDSSLLHHITFSGDDESLDDFGVFIYDTLKAGNYKVCILTHSVSGVAFNSNILTFPEIGDTFYGANSFEVNVNTVETEKEILLKRIVSRVEFVAADPVPDKVKKFHLSVPGRYNTFNLLTGRAGETTVPYVSEHTFLPEERGADIFNTHAYYTLVPFQENSKLTKTILTAKDAEKNTIRQRTIENIPVKANKITRYTGILYTPGSLNDRFDLIFENNGKWDEPIESLLPED